MNDGAIGGGWGKVGTCVASWGPGTCWCRRADDQGQEGQT